MIATQNDYATEEGSARFHRVTQTSRQCRQPMSLLVLPNFLFRARHEVCYEHLYQRMTVLFAFLRLTVLFCI